MLQIKMYFDLRHLTLSAQELCARLPEVLNRSRICTRLVRLEHTVLHRHLEVIIHHHLIRCLTIPLVLLMMARRITIRAITVLTFNIRRLIARRCIQVKM